MDIKVNLPAYYYIGNNKIMTIGGVYGYRNPGYFSTKQVHIIDIDKGKSYRLHDIKYKPYRHFDLENGRILFKKQGNLIIFTAKN